MNQKIFSVSLLKESKIEGRRNEDPTKVFEESIILIKKDENFFLEKDEKNS